MVIVLIWHCFWCHRDCEVPLQPAARSNLNSEVTDTISVINRLTSHRSTLTHLLSFALQRSPNIHLTEPIIDSPSGSFRSHKEVYRTFLRSLAHWWIGHCAPRMRQLASILVRPRTFRTRISGVRFLLSPCYSIGNSICTEFALATLRKSLLHQSFSLAPPTAVIVFKFVSCSFTCWHHSSLYLHRKLFLHPIACSLYQF